MGQSVDSMPRFLNTWSGEFEWHPDPTRVTYAILSHVWSKSESGGEQSYDDVRRIQVAVKKGRKGPTSLAPHASSEPIVYRNEGTIFAHPGLSEKIRGFCKVARKAGFRLVWNDACCIDKTSSAELSEAINSMYEWYRLSDMCYVYLADVPDGDRPWDSGSEFWKSRWHTRGWTLQELIAPENVVFLTQTWSFLGTKIALAWSLREITGVDFDVLVGRASLASISVGKRMSWAANRETTRVEDRAYSLMGLFGIHMSPIYGEGEDAFLRLQEEIIRTIPDHSIFVWGRSCVLTSFDKVDHSFTRSFLEPGRTTEAHPGLLASSPDRFNIGPLDRPATPSHLASSLGLESHEYDLPIHPVFTPEGVSMRLLCLPLARAPHILAGVRAATDHNQCPNCRRLGEMDRLALLQCQSHLDGSFFALPVYRPRQEGEHNRTLFIGTHGECNRNKLHTSIRVFRLARKAVEEILEYVVPVVEEMLLLRHYSAPLILKSLQKRFQFFQRAEFHYFNNTAFEIAPHSLDSLRMLGVDISTLQVARVREAESESAAKIILRTRLTFCGMARRSGNPRIIDLCISLTKEGWLGTPTACISAEGVNLVVSRSDRSPSIPIPSDQVSRYLFVNTSHASESAWNADDNAGHTADNTYLNLDWYRRTITYAEYTFRIDTLSCKDEILRVALEHPFTAASRGVPIKTLWVYIEISGNNRQNKSMVSDVMDRASLRVTYGIE